MPRPLPPHHPNLLRPLLIGTLLLGTLLPGTLLLGALAPTAALAQPLQLTPEETRAREDALEIFRQGKAAYQAGDYAAAQELFLKAWGKYDKEPLIALALGKAYDRDANYDKAHLYYKAFLRLAPAGPQFAKDREWTVDRLKKIEEIQASRPGVLKFKGLPSGAHLEVGGKPADVDAQGELKIAAGTYAVRVTMDKRLPFERAAVMVGPGETKIIEVVLLAPVDPSTLPRDHTWTWVAGSATVASLLTGGLFGILALQEESDYYKRFLRDPPGRPTQETFADYTQPNGKVCAVGFDCPGAEAEGKRRISDIEARQTAMFIGLGAGAVLGATTVVLYFSAPVKETARIPAARPAEPKAELRLLPRLDFETVGATLSLSF